MYFDRIIAVRNDRTIYRDGERCLKVFNEGCSEADVLSEALNQARAAEIGISVPKILEVTMIDGQWVIVSNFIRGKTIARLKTENPELEEHYLSILVKLQLEVNSKHCSEFEKLKDKFNKLICKSDLSATDRFTFHRLLDELPMGDKLCHGDLTPSNVIISEEEIPFILDWSCAMQGNSLADAAASFISLYLNDGSDSANAYLRIYCETSAIDKESIQRWIPIAAAAKLANANAAERELLHIWIDKKSFKEKKV